MNRHYHRWYSPSLHRDMELLMFGHGGARVLVFPTSLARFYEWEDRGLVGALAEHIERGWLQLCCIDSIDAESWYARWRHPRERAIRNLQYDAYVVNEVLPLTRQVNPNPFLTVTGASFGGYHALNFSFRHPEQVGRLLCMSGLCDIRRFTNGYYDENVYFNNPCDYLANEHDPGRLECLRRMDIILAIGRDDPLRGSNEQLSGLLWQKNIWHAIRIWDGLAHDWPVWHQMIRLYIGGHD
ncbi:MAG TPA: alpha/beta hydrolase-fold protein [Bryobacteraceae bacterium]|nr:alpha/beta hydrolase-fold protein [Bryobacteraceae bacterium]